MNQAKKAIISIGWSADGRYLVTGETGHLPCVRVWDMQDMSTMGVFPGHKFGINCVAFSPNMKFIVSVCYFLIRVMITSILVGWVRTRHGDQCLGLEDWC